MLETNAQECGQSHLTQVHKDLELRVGVNRLHFSVGGFTARFSSSVRGVLRDEDEVLIRATKVVQLAGN